MNRPTQGLITAIQQNISYYRYLTTVAIFSLFMVGCSSPRSYPKLLASKKIGCLTNTPPQRIRAELSRLQLEVETLYTALTNIDTSNDYELVATYTNTNIKIQELQKEIDQLKGPGWTDNVWQISIMSAETELMNVMSERSNHKSRVEEILEEHREKNEDDDGNPIRKDVHDFRTGQELVDYMDQKMEPEDSLSFYQALELIKQRVSKKGESQVAQVVETVAKAKYTHDVELITPDSIILSDRIFPTGYLTRTQKADCSGYASESYRMLVELGYDVLRLNVDVQGMKATHGLIAVNIEELMLEKLNQNQRHAASFRWRKKIYVIIEPQSAVFEPINIETRNEKYSSMDMTILGEKSAVDIAIKVREVIY